MKLTNQQIFDTVLTGLRLQGEPSQMMPDPLTFSTARLCAYRAQSQNDPSKTLKCAAGLLIDDDTYRPVWEGKDAAYVESVGGFGDKLGAAEQPLVMELQRAHDEQLTDCFPAWDRAMRQIAQDYGLVYSEPATAEA